MSHQDYYNHRFKTNRKKITFRERIFWHIFFHEIATLNLPSPLQILELGCGPGRLAHRLSRLGSVTAVDTAAGTIAENRKLYPDVNFLVGDVSRELSYQNQFDLVISSEVIEHIHYDRQAQLIENAYRSLKKGGCLILTTPNRIACQNLKLKPDQPIEDLLTLEQVRSLLENKFHILEIFTAVYHLRPPLVDAIWKRLFYPINLFWVQKWTRKTNNGAYIIALAQKLEDF